MQSHIGTADASEASSAAHTLTGQVRRTAKTVPRIDKTFFTTATSIFHNLTTEIIAHCVEKSIDVFIDFWANFSNFLVIFINYDQKKTDK